MWVGIKYMMGKQPGEADTGIATYTLKTRNGKRVGGCNMESRHRVIGENYCKDFGRYNGNNGGQEEQISEEQAGFRPNRSCVDIVYTIGEIFQGGKDVGLRNRVSALKRIYYDVFVYLFPRYR